jgi:hypothetical protein
MSSHQPLSFDDFECLAERMFEQACERSTYTGAPVGAVLAGVIFHLAMEAQLNAVPEAMLHLVLAQAGEDFRAAEANALAAEAT